MSKTVQETHSETLAQQKRELEAHLKQPAAKQRLSSTLDEEQKRLDQINQALATGSVPDPALEQNRLYRRGHDTKS